MIRNDNTAKILAYYNEEIDSLRPFLGDDTRVVGWKNGLACLFDELGPIPVPLPRASILTGDELVRDLVGIKDGLGRPAYIMTRDEIARGRISDIEEMKKLWL